MLKYYHVDHKDKWQCVPEEQIPANAKYESVLYVKYRAEDAEAAGVEQEYWGPFYIDIDSEDLRDAFADMRDIVLYFKQNFGTDLDYRVYASGGKGFHFELNPYLYMDNKFRPGLPLRYRTMAARIKQDVGEHLHIDMGVYSTGKGRQWRRVNVQRENGNYKVWLPDFDTIDIDTIIERVKQPGPVPPKFNKVAKNQLLTSWFMSTKKVVDLAKVTEPVPDNVIKETETPECVVKLARNQDVKSNVNSNLLTMQAISYGIAKGWDIDQIISYNRTFINEYRSSQYRTPAALEDHFRALYDYAKEHPSKFKFGCKMMLSCVDRIDCNACTIKVQEAEERHDTVYIKDGCYWIIPEDANMPHRKLTNFIVKLHKIITREHTNGNKSKSIEIEVVVDGRSEGVQTLDATVLLSKQQFQTHILGLYTMYLGSEKELNMLRLAIAHLSNPKEVNEIDYTGLVWRNDEWHYVTSEGSVSLNGTIDLIKTRTDVNLANFTRLNFSTEEPSASEIIQVIDRMSRMNVAEVIMPLMSWYFNAFFNPHAQFTYETSPSLFVTGIHGSGKTQTMLQLHRLFAPRNPSFPSISATTAFSMNKYASATNLMPLVFDEFKPSANVKKNSETAMVSSAIRASYNKTFESRGTAQRDIEQTPFIAPLAIIGEQMLNEGAVLDRTILVQMDKATHTPEGTKALIELKQLPVEKIGALFLEFAMRVRPNEYTEVCYRYDQELDQKYPNIFDNRPRRNLANLLTAMDFLQQFVLLYTGDERLVDQLQAKMDKYKNSFTSDSQAIHNEIRKTDDITNALATINDLADMMDTSLGDLALMPNRHYKVEGDILYLDVFAVYRNLSQYVKKFNLDIYLTDRSSFLAQLAQKTYTVKKPERIDKIVPGKVRVTIGISLSGARLMGLLMDNFGGKK